MNLSNDLISQFVKITNDAGKKKTESTVQGTVMEFADGKAFVKLDGSDLLTPVNTTVEVQENDRVTVLVKDHTATITGNTTTSSASTNSVKKVSSQITEFETVIAHRVVADEIEVTKAYIDSLVAASAKFTNLDAINAAIENLEAKFIEGWYLSAKDAEILNAEIENLKVIFGEFEDITVEELEAATATIDNLKAYVGEFTYVSTNRFEADNANVNILVTKKLTTDEANIKYANIDFSNIGRAAMEYFYAQSGLIDNVVIGDGTITGNLVGVTIKGDLIDANTLVADKLVIRGENGIYYKLNYDSGALSGDAVGEEIYYKVEYTDGIYILTDYQIDALEGTLVEGALTSENKQVYSGVTSDGETIYFCKVIIYPEWATNALHGSVIVAKSITATQINVSDLVAFDATIGGFNITENSLYSEVKDSEGNTTRGIYMDTDGQFNFGDESNFVRYYRDENGEYKLAISAESILYTLNGSQRSIADVGALTEYVKIGTYQYDDGTEEPCIELGEEDSDFKLIITNTRIMFTDGPSIPAQVSNQELIIGKASVEEELQFGGFVWKKRDNGNMGLLWKGEL